MNVLVACEESQTVCKVFRELGYTAFSCDIQECSGGHPEWHIKTDVLEITNGKCDFITVSGCEYHIDKWDLIIAHPPCTYLSHVATRHHSILHTPVDKINNQTMHRIDSMRFFMNFVFADCDHVAIENPVGVMNTCYRKPDQIIEPYMFAESTEDVKNYVTKRTCLWLKGLPALVINNLEKPDNEKLFGKTSGGKVLNWTEALNSTNRAKDRSKTFPGIAKAMAAQWGDYVSKVL